MGGLLRGWALAVALCLILGFLSDSMVIFTLMPPQDPASENPTIIFHGSLNPLKATHISIMLGNVSILEAALNVTQAVECLFGVYFLFGVSYPDPIRKTLSFIQKCMLNLTCRHEKLPVPCLKMYNQLVCM